jgi:membrane protein
MNVSQWFAVCKKAVVAWVDDLAPSMGAAISYYTMFSLAPCLVLVIAVAGLVFGAEAVQGQIASQLASTVGPDSAKAVQAMVKSAAVSGNGVAATAVSVAVLLVGATSVFAELQSALDRIWHVPEAQKPTGVWGILRARVFSFGLILGVAFVLMVSLAVSTALAAFGTYLGGFLPGQEILLQALNVVVSLATTTLLFAMIFKLMPTARVEWRDVWTGSLVTAILFELGKFLISLYLGKSGMANSFAGAGSLVLLLAWVYYAAQIFLLGAEFTRVYAQEHGSASAARARRAPVRAIPIPAEVPDSSGGEQLGRIELEVDQRMTLAAKALLPKLIVWGAMTVLSLVADQRVKDLNRRRRRAVANAPKPSRRNA